jgi:ATP-binding cassette, subfamily F, member 3
MLRISDLTLSRAGRVLLAGASLAVSPGEHAGVVGANGSGKSTLFAAIRGELAVDRGEIAFPPRWVIAHVAQETPSTSSSLLDHTLDGDTELREIEAELARLENEHAVDGLRLAELHQRFEEIGGHGARARASALLHGLGFASADHARAVSQFSGGWRMRANLAQALMTRSDLLLLDEPTNHLDLDAVLWLEDWLANYRGALLLITHDRDFLDAVVQAIVHVDNRTLQRYAGNYSAFEIQRAERLAQQQSAYASQQRRIAHAQSFIDRFRAKATKARQAQSRLKTLERMERIAAAHVDSPFTFEFAEPRAQPRQLVKLEHAAIGYGNPPLLAKVEFGVLAGQRIGLLGANGAGKSTLLKAIVGDLPLLAGERHTGQGLAIGYFAQHQVEHLRLDESALWHVQRLDANAREQDLRNYLGGFDFRGEQATVPVRNFSGGEKARLALALIVRQRPNLLLLDEPTNHLDIDMREALTEALQDYTGALIVVAHDRHLLRATTDELWLVAGGRVAPFDGDLDDYRALVVARARGSGEDTTETPRIDRRAQKRLEAEARAGRAQARKPWLAKIAQLERHIDTLTREKAELDAWLADTQAYSEANKGALVEKVKRQGEIQAALAGAEDSWLWAQARLEEGNA